MIKGLENLEIIKGVQTNNYDSESSYDYLVKSGIYIDCKLDDVKGV